MGYIAIVIQECLIHWQILQDRLTHHIQALNDTFTICPVIIKLQLARAILDLRVYRQKSNLTLHLKFSNQHMLIFNHGYLMLCSRMY